MISQYLVSQPKPVTHQGARSSTAHTYTHTHTCMHSLIIHQGTSVIAGKINIDRTIDIFIITFIVVVVIVIIIITVITIIMIIIIIKIKADL